MKKLLIFALTFITMLIGVNALDLNNISFTQEEFLNGAVQDTAVLELSNGKLAVAYVKSDNTAKLIVCDLDGTNCGSENSISTNANSVDLVEDTLNSKIVAGAGRSSSSLYTVHNLDGTYDSTFNIFNSNTLHLSMASINDTDFVLGYVDASDSFDFNIVICKKDASSCGSETSEGTGSSGATDLKVIYASDNQIKMFISDFSFGKLMRFSNTGSYLGQTDLTTSTVTYGDVIEGSDNRLKFVYDDGGNSGYGTLRDCSLTGGECSSTVFATTDSLYSRIVEAQDKLFISYNDNSGNTGYVVNTDLDGSSLSGASRFNAVSENPLLSNILYSSDNTLIISYNDNTGGTGELAISESLSPGASITFINPTNGDYINSLLFDLNLTYTSITNSSYQLNNGLKTTLNTNSNTTNTQLTGVEGVNNLTIFTNTSGVELNASISFILDTAQPMIINTLPLEIDSYVLNFNGTTCTDTNLDSCILEINNQSIDLLTVNNTVLTFNGVIPYNITAKDLANNTITENGSIYVNPYVYLYFQNSITILDIEDYNLGGFEVIGNEYKRKFFDIYQGETNLNLSFIKSGYKTTNVIIEMLRNVTINETFNIQPVNLYIKVFDAETNNPVTFDITISNGVIITDTNLIEFNQSFPNIPLGDIKIDVSAENYSNGIYYTTILDNTSLSYNIYLTPEDLTSIITYSVRDFTTNVNLDDVLIEARQIINGEEVVVQQTKTSNGLAYLYLDGLKEYEFIFSKDGYVVSRVNSIPGVTLYTVKLKSDTASYDYIDDVSYRLTPEGSSFYLGQNITFQAFIGGKALTLSKYNITDNFGNLLFEDTSTNPTGTTFTTTQEFLNTSNISNVIVTLSYIVNGQTKMISKSYDVFNLADSGVKQLDDFGKVSDEESKLLRFFIIISTFATFIVLGTKNQNTRDYVSLITLFPLIIFTFVGWIPFLYSTIMALVMIIFFMGGNKR